MDLDRFLPLIIVFIIWRLSERLRKKQKPLKSRQVVAANQEFDIYEIPESEFDIPPYPLEQTVAAPLEAVSESSKKQVVTDEQSQYTAISRKKFFLRRAVVWSEILSPPVSMRD